MKRGGYNVVIPASIKPRPKMHEETAASILAEYFQADVYFIVGSTQRTPDVLVKTVRWEIKSVQGDSPNTIKNNMRKAVTQSGNIVIDLRRSRLHQARAVGYIRHFLNYENAARKIKRLIVINQVGEILVVR